MNKFDRARRKEASRRAKDIWDGWVITYSLAHTRPRGVARKELFALMKDLLVVNGTVSKGMLIDAHRAVSGIAFKVAQAEVETFKPDVAEALRRDGMPLVYPLTEQGLMFAGTVDPNDAVQIARCVPGLGGAGPVAGWRIANRNDDPCFIAYINQRWLSGTKAVQHAHRLATEGLAAGVVSSVAPLPVFDAKLLGAGKKKP